VVCAAVSVLVINTINAMESLCHENLDCFSSESNGTIKVRFSSTPGEKALLLLDTMILGLKSIQDEYGQRYLKLEFKEEAVC